MSEAPVINELTLAARGNDSARTRSRLLYLITRAERGGAQTHVLELALAMRRNFAVEVATGEEGFLTEACRRNGVRVHVLPNLEREIKPLSDWRGFNEIVRLVRDINPDLIHAHTFKAGFLGRLAAKRLGVAAVYTVHMWPFEAAAPLSWRIAAPLCERLAAACCDRLITVSQLAARIAEQYGIAHRSRVVPILNGISDHPARAKFDRDGPLTCVMVARFATFKDHEVLLRAFAGVPGKPRLCLVGDGGTMAETMRIAEELGVAARVDFMGARDDIPMILARADVFVLASKAETLPISILEAMRAGLPVVASDVGGVSEEVIDGETGLLVPPGSPSALRAALSRLLGDRSLRIAMGNAGRRRFEQEFLAETMIGRTRDLYREVLTERLAGR